MNSSLPNARCHRVDPSLQLLAACRVVFFATPSLPRERRKRSTISGGSEEEAMTINDLPAIMGTVLIVAGLALVGIYTRFRTEGSDRSVQAGALLIVVGAVLLGLSLFVPRAK
jgi:hypothetical protein